MDEEREEEQRSDAVSPKEVHIFVPCESPDPLKLLELNVGDILTITFTETVYLWNSDPTEFDPPLEIKIYQPGTSWSGIALPLDDDDTDDFIAVGWLALIPGPRIFIPSGESGARRRRTRRGTQPPTGTPATTVVPLTIHIGGGH
jgi:hypothetical protein